MSQENIESIKRSHEETGDPFESLKIDNDQVLKEATQRLSCPTCNKSVKYFCYVCFQVVGMDRSKVPHVNLPVPLDIIKHPKELDGKSTAIHAKIIAKDDVNLYTWPKIPEYKNAKRTLLLFPGTNAKRLEDIPRDSFDRIAVIDGTWIQANQIARETKELQSMQCVAIESRKTNFWRFQMVDDHHLATIEAIYYLYKEFGESYEAPYNGSYDNLLFYYKFFYHLIQNTYQKNKQAKFNRRHQQKNYIKYKDGEEDSTKEDDEKTTEENREALLDDSKSKDQ
ncbi:DTW domain-containing protein [Sporodiniella umbellata]|nr:DTW domain-containing protein [Sporodiniella umbellata]